MSRRELAIPPEPLPQSEHAPSWRQGLGVGLHYDFHATPADREIGRDLEVDELVDLWRRIGPDWVQCDTKGHPGYASYPSRIGPRPELIPRDPLRAYRDASRKLGLPLVSHYCSLLDETAGSRPEWARVDQDGRSSGRHVCVNSGHRDDFMVPQLLEVIDEYGIDGVWVDGDVWATAPCYCERCQELFRRSTGATAVPRSEAEPGWQSWLTFHRASYERHLGAVANAVHARKPGCLVAVNWAYSLLQPDEISAPLDSLSGDLAHNHTVDWQESEVRFLDGRGLPWDLQQWTFTYLGRDQESELRSVEHLCQSGAITLASGGAACYYLQPRRTGMPVRWQHEQIGEVVSFCKRRVPYSIGTESIPEVAVLHSAESHNLGLEPLPGSTEVGLYTSFGRTAAVKGAVLTLLDLHHHVDVITDRALAERGHEYALLVVPEPRGLSPATLTALERYVEAGGRLLITGAEATELAPRLCGLAAGGAVETSGRYVEIAGRASSVPGPWRLAEPAGAEVLRVQLANQEPAAGATIFPALTMNRVGRGRVATIPGALFASLYNNRLQWRRQVAGLAIEALEPELGIRLEGSPSVHLTYRRRGDTRFVHLLNTAADPPLSPRKLDIERVPETGPITVTLRLPEPPAEVRIEPEGACDYGWLDGELTIRVPRLHIHGVLVIS